MHRAAGRRCTRWSRRLRHGLLLVLVFVIVIIIIIILLTFTVLLLEDGRLWHETTGVEDRDGGGLDGETTRGQA